MKVKRVVCLLLGAILIASMLAACGGNTVDSNTAGNNAGGSTSGGSVADDTSQGTENADPIEITVGFWDVEAGLSGGDSDKMLRTLEEKVGVKLIPQDMSAADYHDKVQLWAATNQLPDIFCGDFIGLGQSSFYDWVDQGVIRALPDDLSAYPNLEEYMQMERAQEAMQNGKHYIIPRRSYGDISYSVLDRTICYRWDLAQQVGVTKEPETWDELRDMLLKIIEADPEGKNIAGISQTGIKTLAGCRYPYGGILEKKWVINDEGRVLPSYFDGDLYAVMNLARDMYTEGTIEKDISNVSVNAKDRFLQGLNAAMAFNDGPASLYTLGEQWEELYGRNFLDDVKFCKIFPASDGEKWYFVDTEAWSETYISSKVDDEKMDAICRLYDFLVSDEGQRLVFCGFEGEDYDMVDGKPVMREGVNLAEKYPFSKISNLAMHNPKKWDESFPSDVPAEYYEEVRKRHEDAVQNGKLPELCDAALMLSTPLKDAFTYDPHTDFLQIMMGTEPVDKMVDELLANYEAKGLSAMLDEVNAKAKELGIIE